MKVPFFNYPKLYEDEAEMLDPVIKDCLKRGAFIMQDDLSSFEKELADYLDVKHVIGVADGTMAILLGLKALDLRAGGEVILPSHTFVATAAAVKHAGLKPVLCDCKEDHLMDHNDLEHRINENTVAILPVQLNGRTCEMDKIQDLSSKYNLKIAEDACQALGSKFNDKYAGTFGLFGALSFYPSKTLGCFGDGGAIITSDSEVYKNIIQLRDHGRGTNGIVTQWGFNSRLDNVQAAILRAKFSKYDAIINKRRALAKQYVELLSDINEIILPQFDDQNHFDVFQNFEIRAKTRDQLVEYLKDHEIGTLKQWGGFCLHQFTQLGMNSDLPFCESLTKEFLMLPLNTTLGSEDIDYVSRTIRNFYN